MHGFTLNEKRPCLERAAKINKALNFFKDFFKPHELLLRLFPNGKGLAQTLHAKVKQDQIPEELSFFCLAYTTGSFGRAGLTQLKKTTQTSAHTLPADVQGQHPKLVFYFVFSCWG